MQWLIAVPFGILIPWKNLRACHLALGLSLVVTRPAFAQAPTAAPAAGSRTWSIDRSLSLATGADLIGTATTELATIVDRTPAWAKRHPLLGISGRIARGIFVDHPVAVFMAVFQHEAFGHGGRAREFGSAATFTLGWPWTTPTLFKGATRFGAGASFESAGLSPTQFMKIYAGGVESNGLAATRATRDLVAGRPLRTMEFLYLVRSRLYVTQYTVGHTPDPAKDPARFSNEAHGGDLATYLGYLSTSYTGSPGFTIDAASPLIVDNYAHIRRQAIANALDPAIWLSAWTIGRQIVNGDEPLGIPMVHAAGRRWLPMVSSQWLTDGGVLSLEIITASDRANVASPWSSLVFRSGHGPGGQIWNAGVGAEQAYSWRSVRLGGEVEVWRQPSFGSGGGVKATMTVSSGALAGLQLELGAKAAGDWPGRPAVSGPFVRIGYRLDARRQSP